MTEVIIRDVPIRFPFKPYKVQEDYMFKVLECLQQGVNGVLESPTGTGKTLSLLCASLAWLQAKKAHVQATAHGLMLSNESQQLFSNNLQAELQKCAGVSETTEDTTWSDRLAMPQIIYASRTHSQLTQVVKELKRSSYSHVKAAILGSRDQLCLHPDLTQEHGFMKVTMCRVKVSGRTCHFYNTFDATKMNKGFAPAEVVDIEDLVRFGNKSKCCPYYLARELSTSADIVFMPYNYLLNPQTRHIQRINLNNAVVILDEAHNVEKMCEESASVHVCSTDIALCMNEVTQVMKIFNEDLIQQSDEDTVKDFTLEDLCILKAMFLALEKAIDEIELNTVKEEGPNKGKKVGRTFPGSYIFELLSKADIQGEKVPVIENALTSLAQFLSTTSSSSLATKGNMLIRFNEFLKVVYASCGTDGDGKMSDMFYKVYIEPEVPKKAKPDSWSNTKTPLNSSAKIVNFWCFSPGFAMRSLLKQGVHCVILTSGTLSPIQATISELGIPIPVQLENPHIIDPSQITVNVLNKGPTGEKLISTYANRENPKYLGDLGRMLVNFCRVVPDGVLMFFPSYPLMEKTVNLWQQEGFWSQIIALKPLFVEPQYRDRLGDVMKEYNSALEAENSHGAVFLAVLRGKVSEGMDFADARCRAVIITGLPYPPFKDPRIILKREYVDNLRKNDPKALSGNDWYQLEATRAVNQAVGRVIRHARDFGAIVLCDCRFESPNITNALSAWVRPHIVKCQEFGPAYGRVSKFFKAMGLTPSTRPVQSGASFDIVDTKIRTKEKKEKPLKENNHNSMQQFIEKVLQTQPKASQTQQPSPSGLFDAIDVSASQSESKKKNVLNTVLSLPSNELTQLQDLPVPKKRKLHIVPLKFDSNEASTSRKVERSKTHEEYIREVKSRINHEQFDLFKNVVKTYAQSPQSNYSQTILSLRKVFPDSKTKDLFIGFKRYVKSEHWSQFDELCLRLFGSVT